MILPTGIPGYETYSPEQDDGDLGSCFVLSIPGLQTELRTNDYYMGKMIS